MDISKITVNFHSSIRIDAGKIIYIDPFKIANAANDADIICITHDHYDYYSIEDILKVVKADTVMVIPEKMATKVFADVEKIYGGALNINDDAAVEKQIVMVKQAETYDVDGQKIDTVAAYNKLKPFHSKKDGWCGDIFDVDGEKVYVAGDTDLTKEASEVSCDVALVPIGGTYTMNSKDAAKLVNKIKPKVTSPVHYGGIIGTIGDADKFKGLVDDGIEVVVKL